VGMHAGAGLAASGERAINAMFNPPAVPSYPDQMHADCLTWRVVDLSLAMHPRCLPFR
jgi:hypothetical protein